MVSIRPNSWTNDRQPGEAWGDRQGAEKEARTLRRADLPTMYDLPSEDPEEPGLPDEYHDLQPQLLSRTLHLTQYSRNQWFTGSDLNLYYDENHQKWYKRPDWFLAVGVSRMYDGDDLRRSFVVWQEGKVPDVVVEFLSAGTAAEDLGRFMDISTRQDSGELEVERTTLSEIGAMDEDELQEKPPQKLEVYETYLKVPHYIVYSRYTRRLRYFRWIEGEYQEQSLLPSNPLIWLDDLAVGLGIWQGAFDEAEGNWLRWCDREGNWLLTDTELAEQRLKEAESKLLQAAQALLRTGMQPRQVAETLGLSEAQVDEVVREQT
jgi:Uma2 family endonuclease